MTAGLVGTGLIGGSVGLALRGLGHKVVGYDASSENLRIAYDRGCVESTGSLADCAQADVVFVSVPPAYVVGVVEEICGLKRPETVVTDCTSTKGAVVDWLAGHKEKNFVPGHPMAGHEKSGPKFASAWMFRGAKWILTPASFTSRDAMKTVEGLVKEMGATPVRLDVNVHDRNVALLSHLPHALAAVLVMLSDDLDSTDASGGSWRDLTRVGGVDPDLWTQILSSNRKEVGRILGEFGARLDTLRAALEDGDDKTVREFFEAARKAKEKHS